MTKGFQQQAFSAYPIRRSVPRQQNGARFAEPSAPRAERPVEQTPPPSAAAPASIR